MEDASFYKEMPTGILTGLFDGHGGSYCATYASQAFPKKFPQALEAAKQDVFQAFTEVINQIHRELAKEDEAYQEGSTMGTTGLVCFIYKNTVYTATIADSEATIYRKINGIFKSIPLSCVRNWGCTKEAIRGVSVLLHDYFFIAKIRTVLKWISAPPKEQKNLRVGSLNVSRALGDFSINNYYQEEVLRHKPKITTQNLHPDDILVLACDGLKDFASEEEIARTIEQNPTNIAKSLVDLALHEKSSTDNVTVLAIQAYRKSV